MLTIADLWLPILVSAVAVWIASAIAWMAMPHHKGDFKQLPDEDAAMSAVRGLGVPPGVYFFPHMQNCNKAKMEADPVAKEKFEKGPHGLLQVWPPENFGKMGWRMGAIFIVYIVIGVFVAYLGTLALPRGSEFMKVFQLTGTAAVCAYCFAGIPQDICFGKPLRTVLANLVDGVAYGLIAGAIFAAMWPGGA